jgi:cytochrome c-type biogenesis protein CcmE
VTRKTRRLYIVLAGLLCLGAATSLVLVALQDTLVFFMFPSDLKTKHVPADRRIRLGGLVEKGSVVKQSDGVTVSFRVTDTEQAVPVRYRGILPDLFREGQGVVTEGRLGPDGVFVADEVLAKHDENYMPREVAEKIKKAGQWKGNAVR